MGEHRASWEHRVLSRLTTIKLASQLLERRAGLSEEARALVRKAIEATDSLATDIHEDRLDAYRTERPAGRCSGVAVIAADDAERERLTTAFRTGGHEVWAFAQPEQALLGLEGLYPRLVLFSPASELGQAEIEAQVLAIRGRQRGGWVLVCLDDEQALDVSPHLTGVAIMRRPFTAEDLLEQAAWLPPVDPLRARMTARSRPSG